MPYRFADWLGMDVIWQADPPGPDIYQPPGTNDWLPWPGEGGGGGPNLEWSADFGLGEIDADWPWQIRNILGAMAGDEALVDIHDALAFQNGELCFNPDTGHMWLQITTPPINGQSYMHIWPTGQANPAFASEVLTESQYSEQIGMGAICRNVVSQAGTHTTRPEFSGFPDAPVTPPVADVIWTYQSVYDDAYAAAIQNGMTPQEAHAVADQIATRIDGTLPPGTTATEIAANLNPNLQDILQGGAVAITLAGVIARWLNFIGDQMNQAMPANASLVNFLSAVLGFLNRMRFCTNELSSFVAARDVPEWPSWTQLGLDVNDLDNTVMAWQQEANNDYETWQQFDVASLQNTATNTIVSGGTATTAFNWAGRMNDCLIKWRGRCAGDVYLPPPQSAFGRYLAYSDCTRDILSLYKPADLTAFAALPKPLGL
jgi:hypothetical protein